MYDFSEAKHTVITQAARSSVIPLEYIGMGSRAPAVASHAIEQEAALKYAKWKLRLQDILSAPCPDFQTIVYQHGGPIVERVGRRAAVAHSKTVTLAPDEDSVWRSEGPVAFSHFYIKKELIADIKSQMDPNDTAELDAFTGIADPEVTALFETASRQFLHHTPLRLESDAWCQLLACAVLGIAPSLQGLRPLKSDREATPTKLHQVQEFIEEYLDQDISLKSLAEIAGLSSYHFIRTFKRTFGKTPHQYVLERRVARAREMLESDPNVALAKIAYSLGFSSQAHLTAVFKQRLGITPGQYRKELIR